MVSQIFGTVMASLRMGTRHGFSLHFFMFLLLGCILSSSSALGVGNGEKWPVVQLRTATIDTKSAPEGLASPLGRRMLLEHAYHTDHHAWGVLKDAHQALVSHSRRLPYEERQQLVDHIEASGARIMGFLPEDTLLVVGRPEELQNSRNHSLVLWAGAFEARHKVAPEWETLLEKIDIVTDSFSSSPDPFSRSNSIGAVNATAVSQMRLVTALRELPVRIQHCPGEWPLVGIRVIFPMAHEPKPLAADHAHAEKHAARIERVVGDQEECHAGTAAAADWAPLLRSKFGEGIQVLAASPDSAIVFASPEVIREVIEWLASRPSVLWVAPLPRMFILNRQASTITQADRPAPSSGHIDLDPSLHPIWAAGITGAGQVVGQGDSGIDYRHCYFYDPAVDWNSGITVESGVRTFDSTTHRKIRLYRAFRDFADSNGHGTHTAGSLAGMPYDTTLAEESGAYIGMAPDAKIAFIDLSSASDGDAITTPYDLSNDYFKYTTGVGAYIHSDSWGSSSVVYDAESSQVDAYCWKNPTFLPVFPAGNDGDRGSDGLGSNSVNSPATSKNCLAAGASQTTQEKASIGQSSQGVYNAKVDLGSSLAMNFRVVQSSFSPVVTTLGNTAYRMSAAQPQLACMPLQNAADVAGTVVLVERGNCTFEEKAQNAQNAGAVGVIAFDDQVGAYFTATSTGGTVGIPLVTIPRRLGQNIMAVLLAGRSANVTFGQATEPQYGFENLAEFSSQGPVGRDRRVKPDIVAPGTLTSAKAGSQCGTATFGGTSMATPVVASSALLIKQYYEDGYYPSGVATQRDMITPSAALLKATMVAGAAPLQGYEADTGLPIDPPPSFRQGYGRVFLGASLFLQGNPYGPKSLRVADSVNIKSGDVHQYCITAGGGPLSIALVWTDYPGNPAASRSLVNDLDLVVRAEGLGGVPLLGNGGNVDDSSSPDSVNNIESIVLPSVPAGRVAVEVRGSSIQASAGPQPYALVVNGDFAGSLLTPGKSGECAVIVAIIISGPTGVTNEKTAKFQVGTESGSSAVQLECRMADANGSVGGPGTLDWSPCSGTVSYGDQPDGSYTFSVRAQGESITSSQRFIKDTTPPAITLTTQGIQSTTSAGTAEFIFSANDATSVALQCMVSVDGASPQQGPVVAGSFTAPQINLGKWYNCTTPEYVAWLLPGRWTFSLQGTDAAGNTADPKVVSWTVQYNQDLKYTRVLEGPILKIPKKEVNYSFAVLPDGAGAATECALATGGPSMAQPTTWKPCTTPVSYGQPTDGDYSFFARIVGDPSVPSSVSDMPGSFPETWAVASFSVDSTAPTVTITSGPTNNQAVKDTSVVFDFTVSEEGASTDCELQGKDIPSDSIPPTPCVTPVQFSNLTGGHYAFQIIARDAVGNVGVPVVSEFIVDTDPPTVSVLAPIATRQDSITVSFKADDGPTGSGIKNVTCRIRPVTLAHSGNTVNPDDPRFDWVQCTSPWTAQGLTEGRWGLAVVAYDNAGLGSNPADRDVWVDTQVPVATISKGPSKDTLNLGGSVEFNVTDSSDAANPGAASPVQWQGFLKSISDEEYQQYVKAGPALPSTNGGTAVQSLRVAIRSQNGDAPAPLSRGDVGQWANCSSSCVYDGLKGGAYAFQAKGTDAAGNAGEPSAPYPFMLEGSSKSLPTWALATIIAGSCIVGFILLGMLWWCCWKRPRRAQAMGRPPTGTITSSAAEPYYGAYPPVAYGHANGNSNGSYPYSSTSPAAGWGAYPANGAISSSTYGGRNSNSGDGGSIYGTVAIPEDPIEAQELALALAVSKQQQELARQQCRAATAPALVVADVADDADDELRRAIEASLRDSQQIRNPTGNSPASGRFPEDASYDAEMRTAIQASLQEEAQRAQEEAFFGWAMSPGTSGGVPDADNSVDWPPRRR